MMKASMGSLLCPEALHRTAQAGGLRFEVTGDRSGLVVRGIVLGGEPSDFFHAGDGMAAGGSLRRGRFGNCAL
jgi:hypothetical protein